MGGARRSPQWRVQGSRSGSLRATSRLSGSGGSSRPRTIREPVVGSVHARVRDVECGRLAAAANGRCALSGALRWCAARVCCASVCVGERVRLRCCARASVCRRVYCAVHLSIVLCSAAAADGKCALCVALRWRATRVCCARVRVGYARASALLVARRCGLCDVLCCAPVYCAVWRRLGWEGCAVGCGALRVVVRS